MGDPVLAVLYGSRRVVHKLKVPSTCNPSRTRAYYRPLPGFRWLSFLFHPGNQGPASSSRFTQQPADVPDVYDPTRVATKAR